MILSWPYLCVGGGGKVLSRVAPVWQSLRVLNLPNCTPPVRGLALSALSTGTNLGGKGGSWT